MDLPIYEFRCEACRRKFETLCRMGEDGSSLTCPECGGNELRRCVSTFAAFSRSGGSSTAIGGSGCSTCSSSNCGSCGH